MNNVTKIVIALAAVVAVVGGAVAITYGAVRSNEIRAEKMSECVQAGGTYIEGYDAMCIGPEND